MPLVEKEGWNPHFKSKFANLTSVLEICKEYLNKHGISILQPHGVNEHGPYVETILLHDSGEYIASRTPITAAKNDPQATGSAITYARRYGCQSIVGLAAEDDDAEAAQGRHIEEKKSLATPAHTIGKAINPASHSPGSYQKSGKKITEKQVGRMMAIAKSSGLGIAETINMIYEYGYKNPDEILMSDYEAICNKIQSRKEDEIPF